MTSSNSLTMVPGPKLPRDPPRDFDGHVEYSPARAAKLDAMPCHAMPCDGNGMAVRKSRKTKMREWNRRRRIRVATRTHAQTRFGNADDAPTHLPIYLPGFPRRKSTHHGLRFLFRRDEDVTRRGFDGVGRGAVLFVGKRFLEGVEDSHGE